MARSSRNTDRVLARLRASERALSAYELLDQLRGEGVSAPPTVYRALSRLIEQGDAHRIESLNAFTACRQGHCSEPVFAVCDRCRRVIELDAPTPPASSDFGAAAAGFEVHRAVVELHGACAECRAIAEAEAAAEA